MRNYWKIQCYRGATAARLLRRMRGQGGDDFRQPLNLARIDGVLADSAHELFMWETRDASWVTWFEGGRP